MTAIRTCGAVLALFVSNGAFAAGPGHEGHVDRDLDLRFPANLAGLTYEEVKTYGKASLGYCVRYGGPRRSWADIFVYDKGFTDIPTGCDNERVRSDASAIGQALKMLEQRGQYTGVKLLREGTVPRDGPVRFAWSRFQYAYPRESATSGPALHISESFVTGYARRFVKIRFTYAKRHERSGERTAAALAAGVSRILLDAAKPTEARAPSFTITVESTHHGEVQQAWLAYLLGRQSVVQKSLEGKPILPGIVAPRYDDEFAGRYLMAEIWQRAKADDAGVSDEYLDALLAVREADLLDEYVWEFLRQPGWPQPAGLDLKEFASWRAANLPGHRAKTYGYLVVELAPVQRQEAEDQDEW